MEFAFKLRLLPASSDRTAKLPGMAVHIIDSMVRMLFRAKRFENEGFTLGDLEDAASDATREAHQRAVQTGVELIMEQDGYLYTTVAGEPVKRIRKLEKPVKRLPLRFKLK